MSDPPQTNANLGKWIGAAVLAIVAVGIAWLAWQTVNAPPASAPAQTQQAEAGSVSDIESVRRTLDAAGVYLQQQEPEKAEAILVDAVASNQADQDLRFLLAETYLVLDRKQEALEQYEAGIFIGPDHPEYRHAAGTLAAELGRPEDAEAHWGVAQKNDPTNPKYPLYRAQMQRLLGRVDEARANLTLAVRLDETLALAWGTLAAIALDENNARIALHYLDNAQKHEPDRLEWRIMEARAHRRLNDPETAVTLLNAVPDSERLASTPMMIEMSMSLAMLGQPERAASMLESAAQLRPDDAELVYQAALWLDRVGEGDRASEFAADAAFMGHEGAKRWLEARARG
ncbi:MAG: tetratricopeptide repeat protein [Planctomycetota bacterium]